MTSGHSHPPLVRSFHGQQLVDPYAWLTDFLRRRYPSDHEGAAFALKIIIERQERNAS